MYMHIDSKVPWIQGKDLCHSMEGLMAFISYLGQFVHVDDGSL